jgi:hypothetical protein
MRRFHVLRWLVGITLFLALAIVPAHVSHAISIPFRGGAEDHYWDVSVNFCRDAVRISASEVLHADNSNGDSLPFSLVLSRTATLITTPLPIHLYDGVGGQNRTLPNVTVAYPYATSQLPGTALDVVIERWEHGENSAAETGGDLSDGDDRETISGTVANCTAATIPTFDTPPMQPRGQTLTIVPGMAISIPIEASDADIFDTVTITGSGLPAGATVTSNLVGNPATANLQWTPSAAQIGAYTLTLSAQDSTGRAAIPYTIDINVGNAVYLPFIVH